MPRVVLLSFAAVFLLAAAASRPRGRRRPQDFFAKKVQPILVESIAISAILTTTRNPRAAYSSIAAPAQYSRAATMAPP